MGYLLNSTNRILGAVLEEPGLEPVMGLGNVRVLIAAELVVKVFDDGVSGVEGGAAVANMLLDIFRQHVEQHGVT